MINMPHITSLVDDLLSMTKSIIIKRTDIADKYETLDSIRAADYYILASQGLDTFDTYISYPAEVLQLVGFDDTMLAAAYWSKNNIPENMRNLVLNAMRNYIIMNYVETNDYYRELNGQPDYEDTTRIYLNNSSDIIGVDKTKSLDQMNNDEIVILTTMGIIDQYIQQYPTKKYLKFLGQNRIDIVIARLANRYDILQMGSYKNNANKDMFLTNYELARQYILATAYQPEMFGDNEHYDAYIGMLIVSQAMKQCITSNLDIMNGQSYYDDLTVKYILQSYGLDIFDDIPLKYRKSIADNIGLLIKYKGTDKVFNLVYNVFGFNNMDVFKYYITKQVNRDVTGNAIINPDPTKMYNLNMVQVNINSDNISLDIRNQENLLSYDEVTNSDPFWGVYDTKDAIKSKLLAHDFNYVDSKYIAINTAYDITAMNFEINYLMNTLLALKNYELGISLKLQDSIYNIPLFDVIVYLFALISKQIGYAGNIPSSMAGVASVYRFNFEENINDLQTIASQYPLANNYVNFNTIKMQYPSGSVSNSNDLLNYYFNNVNIYNILVNYMNNAQTKDQYSLAKQLMDYLMKSKQSTTIYTKTDGTVAATYYDYLVDKQPTLAFIVSDIGLDTIDDKINQILQEMDDYMNSTKLQYMFTKIPTANDSLIKNYISKVISVFKSYTVDIHALNMIYDIDDDINNKFRLFDDVASNDSTFMNNRTGINSSIGIQEFISNDSTINIYDEIDIVIIRGGIEYEF